MQHDRTLPLSPGKTQWILWSLLCLMPIVGMAVDLVAPSLPAIAEGLHVSHRAAKNAISIYLLGYALGNFCTGFLTDAWGRQKLLRVNLAAFVFVSLIPVFLPTINFLLLARFLQGFTIGAVAVVLRAVCSDILSPEKLVRWGTLMGTMWGLGPVFGPVLGGYLQSYVGWKAGFYFFAVRALIGFMVTFFVVPETHVNRHSLQFTTIRKHLIEVITHQQFMAMVILMGLAYALMIVFNTMGPFLIQTIFHYSPIFFGRLAFYLGLIFLLSTFVCRYFLKRYPVKRLFFAVINWSLVIALILFGVSLSFKNSLLLTTVTSGLMFFVCGFLFPMSMGKGMSLFRHIAGTASATMYLINMSITSFFALLVSFITIHSFLSLMSVYLLLLFGCVFIYWKVIRKYE